MKVPRVALQAPRAQWHRVTGTGAEVCWCEMPSRSRRHRRSGAGTAQEGQRRDGGIPPQPSGRMGLAADLFVVTRRR